MSLFYTTFKLQPGRPVGLKKRLVVFPSLRGNGWAIVAHLTELSLIFQMWGFLSEWQCSVGCILRTIELIAATD